MHAKNCLRVKLRHGMAAWWAQLLDALSMQHQKRLCILLPSLPLCTCHDTVPLTFAAGVVLAKLQGVLLALALNGVPLPTQLLQLHVHLRDTSHSVEGPSRHVSLPSSIICICAQHACHAAAV